MAIEITSLNNPVPSSQFTSLNAQGFEITNYLENNSNIELNLISIPTFDVLDTISNYFYSIPRN